MDIYVKKITEAEFNGLDVPVIFYDEPFARSLGIITNGKQSFKLSWNSTEINPLIKEITSNRCCIGIDQLFAILDFDNNAILLKLDLFYNFYTTEVFGATIYVITELEIIKINIITLQVLGNIGLLEFYKKMEMINGVLVVTCVDGSSVEIS